MTIQQLKYFVGIVEHKSMNKAAMAMHISQSSLSLSMKNLADEIGMELMCQQGRNLVLTNAGEFFYTNALKIIEAFEKLAIETRQHGEHSNMLSVVSDVIDFSSEILINIKNEQNNIRFFQNNLLKFMYEIFHQ